MAANGFDDDQTRSFTNLAAGTKVSHYKIISKIGAGGMGEVYLAEDTELDREVELRKPLYSRATYVLRLISDIRFRIGSLSGI